MFAGPPPEVVTQEDEMGVEYVSTMARAQRADEANSVLRSIETIAPLLEAKPDLLDNFNMDEIARATRRWYGGPQKFYNSKKVVESMRQDRAEATQVRQEQEQAMIGAEVDLKTAKAKAA